MNRYTKAALFLITAVITSKLAWDLSADYDALSRDPDLSNVAILLCMLQMGLQISGVWLVWTGLCYLFCGRRRKLLG